MQRRTYITYEIDDVKKLVAGEIKKAKLAKQEDLEDVKKDVATLKTDVSTLKTDVSGLKTDVSGLKTDVSNLKYDVKTLGENLDSFRKESNEKLDRLYTLVDGFAGEVKGYREEQALVSDKLSSHGTRLEKLEKHTGLPTPTA